MQRDACCCIATFRSITNGQIGWSLFDDGVLNGDMAKTSGATDGPSCCGRGCARRDWQRNAGDGAGPRLSGLASLLWLFSAQRADDIQVFLEWFHRLDAFLVGIALLVVATASVLKRQSLPRWLPWLSCLLVAGCIPRRAWCSHRASAVAFRHRDGASGHGAHTAGLVKRSDPTTASAIFDPVTDVVALLRADGSACCLHPVAFGCTDGNLLGCSALSEWCRGLPMGGVAPLNGDACCRHGVALRWGGLAGWRVGPSSMALSLRRLRPRCWSGSAWNFHLEAGSLPATGDDCPPVGCSPAGCLAFCACSASS